MTGALAGCVVAGALVGGATVARSVSGGEVAPRHVVVSPVVPPEGGFAVPADRMDATLGRLVAAETGLRVRPASIQRLRVDRTGGALRAVQSGAVQVDTPQGPAVISVDVRRARIESCAIARCVSVVNEGALGARQRSTVAVVVNRGVEVRVRTWSGARRLAVGPDVLLRLADERAWTG